MSTFALEVTGNDSEFSPVPSEEIEVPETVAGASTNIVLTTRSDHDISAKAVEITAKLRKDNVKSSVNVAWTSSSDGGLVASGDSEAVANTSMGNCIESLIRNGAPMMKDRLSKSHVSFEQLVGTIAANDDPDNETLNYNQVFVDSVSSRLASLMKTDADVEIVKSFLLKTLHLQRIDNFTLGEGVMLASSKVIQDRIREKEVLQADFEGNAIGRVVPVDSWF